MADEQVKPQHEEKRVTTKERHEATRALLKLWEENEYVFLLEKDRDYHCI